jgi:hypothetical protein
MKKKDREKLIRVWLIEDAKLVMKQAKELLTYEEIVMILTDSLGEVFIDILDYKELDLEKLQKRKVKKLRKITQKEL